MIPLFGVFPKDEWLFHNIEYDWHSAGHYFWHKYTSNGFAPIAPKVCISRDLGIYVFIKNAFLYEEDIIIALQVFTCKVLLNRKKPQ